VWRNAGPDLEGSATFCLSGSGFDSGSERACRDRESTSPWACESPVLVEALIVLLKAVTMLDSRKNVTRTLGTRGPKIPREAVQL
jgi:hypothetical protein